MARLTTLAARYAFLAAAIPGGIFLGWVLHRAALPLLLRYLSVQETQCFLVGVGVAIVLLCVKQAWKYRRPMALPHEFRITASYYRLGEKTPYRIRKMTARSSTPAFPGALLSSEETLCH